VCLASKCSGTVLLIVAIALRRFDGAAKWRGRPLVYLRERGREQHRARDTESGVWCWGTNVLDPATANPTWCSAGYDIENNYICTFHPAHLPNDVRFKSLSDRGGACGVTSALATYCWYGSAERGGLPRGYSFAAVDGYIRYDPAAPHPSGLGPCAVTPNHEAFCWGDNTYGQVGSGRSGTVEDLPLQVAGDLSWSAVHPGRWFTCGLTLDGAVYC
jgi:hypothetical protein